MLLLAKIFPMNHLSIGLEYADKKIPKTMEEALTSVDLTSASPIAAFSHGMVTPNITSPQL